MRKLDIEKIKLQIDESEEAFAKDINISLDELRSYCNGTAQPSAEVNLYMAFCLEKYCPEKLGG